MMDYISIAEAAAKWGITPRRVQVLCAQSRIPGLTKFGKAWAIPKDAEKPQDARKAKLKAHNYIDLCKQADTFRDLPPEGKKKP